MSPTIPSTELLPGLALVNPPRKAKKASSSSLPSLLPKASKDNDASSEEDNDSEPSWTPVPHSPKRGRKPANASLSRSAREAQRRENHSRIEKLRRTKINEALATLRELVPPDYGRLTDRDAEALEDDDAYVLPSNTKPARRPVKEKEFKLEILVRTVTFMQDLIARNQEMEKRLSEGRLCSSDSSKKRKPSGDETDVRENSYQKRKRNEEGRKESLPSISSWLADGTEPASYLPSPPSSTHLPTLQSQSIPPLSLGPSATPPQSVFRQTPPSPEEESAASVLLHFSASRRQSLPQTDGQPSELPALTPSSLMGLRPV